MILRAPWRVICQKNPRGLHYGWFEGFCVHAIYDGIIFRESSNTNFGTPCRMASDPRLKIRALAKRSILYKAKADPTQAGRPSGIEWVAKG